MTLTDAVTTPFAAHEQRELNRKRAVETWRRELIDRAGSNSHAAIDRHGDVNETARFNAHFPELDGVPVRILQDALDMACDRMAEDWLRQRFGDVAVEDLYACISDDSVVVSHGTDGFCVEFTMQVDASVTKL